MPLFPMSPGASPRPPYILMSHTTRSCSPFITPGAWKPQNNPYNLPDVKQYQYLLCVDLSLCTPSTHSSSPLVSNSKGTFHLSPSVLISPSTILYCPSTTYDAFSTSTSLLVSILVTPCYCTFSPTLPVPCYVK
jgi:hypothetical protein